MKKKKGKKWRAKRDIPDPKVDQFEWLPFVVPSSSSSSSSSEKRLLFLSRPFPRQKKGGWLVRVMAKYPLPPLPFLWASHRAVFSISRGNNGG